MVRGTSQQLQPQGKAHYLRSLNLQTQRDRAQGLPQEFLSGFGDKVLLCGSECPIIHSIPPASALNTGILGMSHHAQHFQLERNCLLNQDIYESLLSEIQSRPLEVVHLTPFVTLG